MAGAAIAEPARPMPAAVRNSRRFNARFIGVPPVCLSTKGDRKRDDDPPIRRQRRGCYASTAAEQAKSRPLLQRTLTAIEAGTARSHHRRTAAIDVGRGAGDVTALLGGQEAGEIGE